VPAPDLLSSALRYAARGWKVFPLKGKHPFPGSHGHVDATTERSAIRHWWSLYPDANVGIACSSTRGPIIIDLDGPTGRRFIEELGIPETYEATSRNRKRRHLYFAPPLDGTTIRRMIRPLGKELSFDVLGDGGYVVAPPSIHPDTGRRYKWLRRRDLMPFPITVQHALNGKLSGAAPRHMAAAPLPVVIGEGHRDELLTSLAGSMRRRGASAEAIYLALQEENETRCDPPLSSKQIRKIANSISLKEPAPLTEHLTDLGNARRFVGAHHEHVRCATGRRSRIWYAWDGPRWVPDATGAIERLAKTTVRDLYREAATLTDTDARDGLLKHAAKSEAAPRVKALLELASTEPEVALTADAFDADPWLLNVNNGTLNLKTGKLQKHQREDLITKLAPVDWDPKAKAPRWTQFLHEITDGDRELQAYLQRIVGYGATGDVREECLFFCYGQGGNGKSKFFETIRAVLGDYAQQSDFSTFMERHGDGPRNDLARMRGARFVTASEASGERPFDGRILKQLTGGDTITARKLYEELFEFKPQHKLFLAANHKPVVKEQSEAFWRRLRLIPFTVTFDRTRRDDKLLGKLLSERNGILQWIAVGCLEWQRNGLGIPSIVRKATNVYKEENDVLGEFVASSCVLDPAAWASTTELFRAFNDWWLGARGTRTPISVAWFSRLLSERAELTPTKRNGVRGWRGINTLKELAT